MKILFVGSVVPDGYDLLIEDISAAGNRYQINFCSELLRQGHEVAILSYIGVNMPTEVDLSDGCTDFCSEIKYVCKENNTWKSVKRLHQLIKDEIANYDVVIAYNVIYAWLNLPKIARKNNIQSVLILADYTEPEGSTGFKNKIYASFQMNTVRQFDKVVTLSKRSEKILKSKQKIYCMEGGISEEVYSYFAEMNEVHSPIRLNYSGLLHPVMGVDLLLEAFKKVTRSDVRLYISGKGPLKDKVIQASREDSRIIYTGFLSYDEYLKQLKEADILINPRNMELKENYNNFPSKIMEYLATGKMIVSTKFYGCERFPKDIVFSDSTVAQLKENIEFGVILVSENIRNRFETERAFAEDFLWEKQIQRLVMFLEQ